MWTTLQIILATLLTANASDFPKHFVPLTDRQRATCTADALCTVTQSKNNEKYQVLFTLKNEKNANWIESIRIVNTNDNTSEDFRLPSKKRLGAGETTPLFAVDINNDGYYDIALQTGLSAKKGFVYHYWVYNPKKKTFVLTHDAYPALKSIGEKKIASLSSTENFTLNDKYQIVESKKK